MGLLSKLYQTPILDPNQTATERAKFFNKNMAQSLGLEGRTNTSPYLVPSRMEDAEGMDVRMSLEETLHAASSGSSPDEGEGQATDGLLNRYIRQEASENHETHNRSTAMIDYYDNIFSYRQSQSSALTRARRESVIVANLKTSVIIENEHAFMEKLAAFLADRYDRIQASVMIIIDHAQGMMLNGSFDRSYILIITALPHLLQETTNKRNAALIQAFFHVHMNVPASRGVLIFSAVAEENFATNGNTVLGHSHTMASSRRAARLASQTSSQVQPVAVPQNVVAPTQHMAAPDYIMPDDDIPGPATAQAEYTATRAPAVSTVGTNGKSQRNGISLRTKRNVFQRAPPKATDASSASLPPHPAGADDDAERPAGSSNRLLRTSKSIMSLFKRKGSAPADDTLGSLP